MSTAPIDLLLASTSRYRRELLGRLGIPFRVESPGVDETAQSGETPPDLAARLARAKALAVAARNPGALVIGSDQVAELDGRTLGKPGTTERARAQLAACSGRTVAFHTALCLADARAVPLREHSALDLTRVVFRTLGDDEIARYVALDDPLDCAGSFKSEAGGIALFERIETTDPSALVGLPLIALGRVLREAGIAVP